VAAAPFVAEDARELGRDDGEHGRVGADYTEVNPPGEVLRDAGVLRHGPPVVVAGVAMVTVACPALVCFSAWRPTRQSPGPAVQAQPRQCAVTASWITAPGSGWPSSRLPSCAAVPARAPVPARRARASAR